MTTINMTIAVPVDTDGTNIQTQYGCRFPDGHIEWSTFTDYANVAWSFENVIKGTEADGTAPAAERWGLTVRKKAAAASIDLAEYGAAHQFLKRTVILVTTAPEEV